MEVGKEKKKKDFESFSSFWTTNNDPGVPDFRYIYWNFYGDSDTYIFSIYVKI